MDERSSSDDASTVRGSLVDSRRLLFEKYVTEQANRPEGTDEAVAVIRQNGRLPRSVRASKVNSFRDELVPSNRVVVRQLSTNNNAAATVVRRRSHNDEDFATDTQQGADERASSVPSPAAAANADQSPPSLPTLPASQTVASSIAASETSPPSGESVSQVPHNECHSPEGPLLYADSGSPVPTVLCQSSADASPPNCSKRISYHHAVLNGAKLKLAETSSPPATVLETSSLNSPPSNGEGGADDHSVNLNLPDTPRLRNCESLSFTAVVATSKKSSPVEDLSASTNDCQNSLNSSSRETCQPVVVEAISDEPASINVPTANSEKIAPIADSDNISKSGDTDKITFSTISNSSVESAASNKSARPVAANKPTKPAIGSKPVRSVIKNKPIYSSSPVTVPAAATAEYPEDLNPFGDDDDDDYNNDDRKLPEMSWVAIDREHDSTNPFGSDSDDDDPNGSKYNAANTNPFWSGSEEEEEEDNEGSASRTPVPLPRLVESYLLASSSL